MPILIHVCPFPDLEVTGPWGKAPVAEVAEDEDLLPVATVQDQMCTGQDPDPFLAHDHRLRHWTLEQEAVDIAAAHGILMAQRRDRFRLRQEERMTEGFAVTGAAEEAVAEAMASMAETCLAAVAKVEAELEAEVENSMRYGAELFEVNFGLERRF